MRLSFTGALVAAVLSFASWVPAQGASPPSSTAGTSAPMLATERFLFVIHGQVLYQFDIQSLALLHTFQFPAGTRPVAAELGVEPPPPPPAPSTSSARSAEELGKSIQGALAWLAAHQDPDGHWDADGFMKHDKDGEPSGGPGNAVHDVGVTGLALLAFLGNGNTLRSGPHKDTVKLAASWLRSQQQENGLIGVNASHDFIYDHAIAAYAITEAFGLSNYQLLKPVAQKAINYLESHRNPYAVWRYQPRDNDNDTSVTTWAASACASGKFFGLEVNEQALQLAGVWYDQVTSPDGRAGYTKQGEPSSRKPGDHSQRFPVEHGEAMTAAALYGRLMLGQTPQTKPIMKASADRLLANLPAWEKDRIDSVYWYFGTYAMFQMGGGYWAEWRGAIGTLVDHQRRDGNAAGSWDPIGVWDEDGGRVFVTALNTLSLEAFHRHTKLVKK